MQFTLTLLAAVATGVIATPVARSSYAVKETHFVPRDWSRLGRSHGGKTIQLQIGLKQGSFEELDRQLHESTIPAITIFVASKFTTEDSSNFKLILHSF